MRIVKLQDIATAQVGYTFRESLSEWAPGGVAVIQMKDVSDAGFLSLDGVTRIQLDDANENHRLATGDIIFRSRGIVNTSVMVGESNGQVVLSAPLYRIRVEDQSVDPAYLSWYLNQATAKAYFKNVGKGSLMVMVSKQDLLDLPVTVPPQETQRNIVELAGLVEKERVLSRLIVEKREKVIGATLARIVSEA